jgi:hypothetical protein
LSDLNVNGGVALLGEENLLVFRSVEVGRSLPPVEAGLVNHKNIPLTLSMLLSLVSCFFSLDPFVLVFVVAEERELSGLRFCANGSCPCSN